jgi:hypothetical protein
MLPLLTGGPEARPARLLVIGAIRTTSRSAAGGAILKLVEQGATSAICWVVLSGNGGRGGSERARAAERSRGEASDRPRLRAEQYRHFRGECWLEERLLVAA